MAQTLDNALLLLQTSELEQSLPAKRLPRYFASARKCLKDASVRFMASSMDTAGL